MPDEIDASDAPLADQLDAFLEDVELQEALEAMAEVLRNRAMALREIEDHDTNAPTEAQWDQLDSIADDLDALAGDLP